MCGWARATCTGRAPCAVPMSITDLYIAARPRQTLDEPSTDWVDEIHEHDGHAGARLLQRRHGERPGCQDDIRRERDQLRCIFAMALGIAGAKAVVDPHV